MICVRAISTNYVLARFTTTTSDALMCICKLHYYNHSIFKGTDDRFALLIRRTKAVESPHASQMREIAAIEARISFGGSTLHSHEYLDEAAHASAIQ